jgi:hypothetical protein
MCFSVSSLTKARLDYARHRSDDPALIASLEKELEELLRDEPPLGWVSGFSHPRLLVFTQQDPLRPRLFRWGLVPSWVQDRNRPPNWPNKPSMRVPRPFGKNPRFGNRPEPNDA